MYKEVLINIESHEKRVAILDGTKLENFFIERPDNIRIVGNIYKGKVSSILPGIGACFVNIGLERNGFLYLSDLDKIHGDFEESSVDFFDFLPFRKNKTAHASPKHRFKIGDTVCVQIVKEPFGKKGARLTTNISLPGRYVVLMPSQTKIGISKRIDDPMERERLKELLNQIDIPENVGLIIRTQAQGVPKNLIVRDLKYLMHLWKRIKITTTKVNAPYVIYQEFDLIQRLVRDSFGQDLNKIIVDSKDEYKRLLKLIRLMAPHLRSKLEFYRHDEPLFEKRNIEGQVAQLYERHVKLPSGGYIVIDPTEALVAIDVNSGSYTGKKDIEDTAFKINVEASNEIARQLRLRDLGGIIVIDFIDMNLQGHRQECVKTLREAVRIDKSKTEIFGFSELGVVQMTRQKKYSSIGNIWYQTCPYCKGKGSIKSQGTMTIQVLREIKAFLKTNPRKNLQVSVHPEIASRLFNEDKQAILVLEKRFRIKISIKADSILHYEDIKITNRIS